MAQHIREPGSQTREPVPRVFPVEVGIYLYFRTGQQLCFLTFKTDKNGPIKFSAGPEDIIVKRQIWSHGLNIQASQFLERIRLASIGSHVIADHIVIREQDIRLGPYLVNGIGYQVAIILRAIHAAYVPEGTIRLTFLSDWPKYYQEETLEILIAKGCQSFASGLQL